MDHQTFDRLTRLFGIAGSRRTAWRVLLGGALLGATTRAAAAGPCDTGTNPECTCGKDTKCPPGMCFWDPCPAEEPRGEFCCSTEFGYVFCGDRCCLDNGNDPCAACRRPSKDPPEACLGEEAIIGSYRRR
jgi:hypothetical protein